MTAPQKALVAVTSSIIFGAILGWFAHSWHIQGAGTPANPPMKTLQPPLSGNLRGPVVELQKGQTHDDYAGLLREIERLTEENAALKETNERTSKFLAQSGRSNERMTEIASKLAADPWIDVPEGMAESAVFIGKLHRASSDFNAKWGDTPPEEGTPESEDYQTEHDALTADYAAFMKVIESSDLGDVTGDPKSAAQFQSLQLWGALELEDDQWAQLEQTVNRHYTDGFNRKLEMASKPESGVEDWQQQRADLSQKAFDDITALLTPDQRLNFQRLYKPDFLWNMQIGMH